MFRNGLLAVVIVMVCGVNAFAQGTYVSASVFGDIVRSTHSEQSGGFIDPTGGGEALGFALRAGTPLGAVWGVEVEFARPGAIESDSRSQAFPLSQSTLSFSFTDGLSLPARPIVPPLFYEVRSSQRNTTLSAALWIQQQLSGRVAMVYLGGIGFDRSEQEIELTYGPLLGVGPVELLVPPSARTKSVFYGVRPMVGVESRIGMTEHAHIVPGLRLHAGNGMWLVRPSVGLAWTF
jgi:hypothetical protein